MGIYDPYSIYPNVSRQDMTVLSSAGLNILWGINPDYSPSEFLAFFPEFTGLVEDGSIPVITYFDTAAMVADQANQTIRLVYKAGSTLYELDLKTGNLTDYTVSPAASPYNSLFNVYGILASSELSEERFNEVWTYVMGLYIAHKMIIRLGSITAVSSVTDPTTIARILSSNRPALVNSESVGGVSVSYDVGATLSQGIDSGDWNRTQYGQELVNYMQVYGIDVWLVGL